jgi:hypothetical protein
MEQKEIEPNKTKIAIYKSLGHYAQYGIDHDPVTRHSIVQESGDSRAEESTDYKRCKEE